MIVFQVHDMTCGHCASRIARAVKDADGGAKVAVDLAKHRVEVEQAIASVQELSDAIKEAGYTPIAIESAAGRLG